MSMDGTGLVPGIGVAFLRQRAGTDLEPGVGRGKSARTPAVPQRCPGGGFAGSMAGVTRHQAVPPGLEGCRLRSARPVSGHWRGPSPTRDSNPPG